MLTKSRSVGRVSISVIADAQFQLSLSFSAARRPYTSFVCSERSTDNIVAINLSESCIGTMLSTD